jgi:DNA-directed RNA polymerase specialized sigma24 family protein
MRRSKYSEDTIIRMVRNYAELREVAGTRPGRPLDTLLRLADLDRALAHLSRDLWRVMLVHGLIGVPQAEAAVDLKISQQAVSKRFRLGIEELYYHMNQEELSDSA